ncbi:toprim domain-containing protein [Runella slithyformis]|uniref:Mobilizable transposon, excision protein, putative n=1 Tax=Runella slithyformis (strain ATCC 29530 / DSM 19594 / LMG 11500 / NCIMB 11436 / LSU 4) TaxID=761193 RepID=A0A7U3ZM00_RUNSL|nr:toprim domain-containing protein [Runella slithyformis]AEI49675.1 mobilizable transposon, excision protein, putative [Runella slithyformis DSM 19594]
MIPNEVIQRLKTIPITAYLSSMGIEPVKEQNGQLLYYSPFKDEHSPSFFVNPHRNVFKDFTTNDKGGDVITLVRRLKACDFAKAVQLLEVFDGITSSFSFNGRIKPYVEKSPLEVLKVKPLENKALIAYLSNVRGIPFAIASKYVKECYFKVNDKYQFAVCFENDLKGLELRNVYVQLSTNPKSITTLKGTDNSTALIFEGFMDFLSYIVCQGKEPDCDVIVCNSISNINKALPILNKYSTLLAYLDNDAGGKTGVTTIQNAGIKLTDCSGLYAPYKDLNEYLTKWFLQR